MRTVALQHYAHLSPNRRLSLRPCIQPWFALFASLMEKVAGNVQKTAPVLPATVPLALVMLADDDIDDRELFQETITRINSQVHVQTVSDGSQLLALLNNTKTTLPDIVFLDLNMPGKNGLDCLREIKSSSRLKELPVVIYSTSAHMRDISETYCHGANLYIKKPNSFNGLMAVIKAVFSIDLEKLKLKPPIAKFVITPDLS